MFIFSEVFAYAIRNIRNLINFKTANKLFVVAGIMCVTFPDLISFQFFFLIDAKGLLFHLMVIKKVLLKKFF